MLIIDDLHSECFAANCIKIGQFNESVVCQLLSRFTEVGDLFSESILRFWMFNQRVYYTRQGIGRCVARSEYNSATGCQARRIEQCGVNGLTSLVQTADHRVYGLLPTLPYLPALCPKLTIHSGREQDAMLTQYAHDILSAANLLMNDLVSSFQGRLALFHDRYRLVPYSVNNLFKLLSFLVRI